MIRGCLKIGEFSWFGASVQGTPESVGLLFGGFSGGCFGNTLLERGGWSEWIRT
ncbi:MAG: hypothetical protein ACTSUQ_00300 [Candidatus Freyarchaeota archaeon]